MDTPRAAARIRPTTVALGLAALALVIAADWAIRHAVTPANGPPAAATYLELGITFPNNVIPAFGVALSPDGRYLATGAFTNSPQIWVHSFQSSETQALAGANGNNPFWSPDSSTIAYFSASKLMTMPVARGTATTIAEVPPSPSAGSWKTNGIMLFSAQGKVYHATTSGSTPVQVSLKGLVGTPIGTRFLPDGRHFIVFGEQRGGGLIQVASLDSDQVTPLVASVAPGAFAPPDRLLFVRNTSLMTQRLDMTRFVLTGEAEVIASGVTQGSRGDIGALVVSASSNGMIALPATTGGSQGRLTWFDRDGKPGESIEASPDAEDSNPAISPDGTLVASNRNPSTNGQLGHLGPAGSSRMRSRSPAPAIQVGPARTLVDRPVLSLIDGRTHYDITRDGTRLLVRAAGRSAGPAAFA